MKAHTLLLACVAVAVSALPTVAQQSNAMHRYLFYFKYTDQAMKAMTENPQDRAAQAGKLAETFGGKLESFYLLPTGGEWDGLTIQQMPEGASEALSMYLRATGNFQRTQVLPLMTADEFRRAMEKARSVNTTYTAPTSTK